VKNEQGVITTYQGIHPRHHPNASALLTDIKQTRLSPVWNLPSSHSIDEMLTATLDQIE